MNYINNYVLFRAEIIPINKLLTSTSMTFNSSAVVLSMMLNSSGNDIVSVSVAAICIAFVDFLWLYLACCVASLHAEPVCHILYHMDIVKCL